MANTQETIVDIIAAMRDEGHTGESSCLEWVGTKMRYYADRLEAAWRREKSAIVADALFVGGMIGASRKPTTENSSVVGDAAKMREALKTVKRYFDGYTVNILELRRKVDAALTAPPRNCEVGTEEEQVKRHEEWCDRNTCMFTYSCRVCFAKWLQMSYEKGGAE